MEREQRVPDGESGQPIANSLTTQDTQQLASTVNGPMHLSCSLAWRTSRRTLLRAFGMPAVVGVGAMLAMSLGAVGCTVRAPSATPSKGSTPSAPAGTNQTGSGGTEGTSSVIGNARQIPPNSAATFDAIADNGPGVLIHLPDGRFVAYDAICTHEGCTVAYHASSQHLECPCHGSIFDPANAGQVLSGPARLPLAMIKITIDNSTGTITQD